MKTPSAFSLCLFTVIFAALMGCSKSSERQKDPALQTALDELTRLNSFAESGVTYTQYSERLLAAKGNIELALRRTNDESAKIGIKKALNIYLSARDQWKNSIDSGKEPTGLQERWESAKEATNKAAEYAFADNAARENINEPENQQSSDGAQANAGNEAQNNKMAAFAPGETGFNVNPISITNPDGSRPRLDRGTELTVVKQNPDGTLHIKSGEIEADVPVDDVTNDSNLAAELRNEDQKAQEASQQSKAQQAAAAQQMR